ncbi:MAG: DUF2157 domain-containing protein [Trichlorobacter sp.]|uniref:DUF2157 domain-containing protein n=1 Tax=Trichlorobacter sp. TaxID=2911007 RepID=UPI0025627EDB|nr:DUF2157 domain-containing protein [Trichlorobacter sp.]MDK9718036.1 DUF2157 domain-containing protein [Trichlorobacter sp.]
MMEALPERQQKTGGHTAVDAAVGRDDAQRRTDRITAFKQELSALETAGALTLSDEQKTGVAAYHAELLAGLQLRFDVDISGAARQMSLGMRIVSFLGALALSAAVFFFFYRFWGNLGTGLQVGILSGAPLLILAGVEFAARRERTLYFASLISLVVFAAFVLNLSMFGQIFTITPSQNAFLVWGALALILAYTYHLKLVLVAGLTSLMGYLAATVGVWGGLYWLSFGERPENIMIAGLILFAAAWLPGSLHRYFAGVYRLYGLLVVLLSLLMLSHWGASSYFTFLPNQIEHGYQVASFFVAAGVIWFGIRNSFTHLVNLGSTFFVLYLYTKFFDWWWDWMPKYLFFLVLGGIAIGLLLLLKRMRGLVREVKP